MDPIACQLGVSLGSSVNPSGSVTRVANPSAPSDVTSAGVLRRRTPAYTDDPAYISAVSKTASAETMSPLGCAPTRRSTPRKPTNTPTSFAPVTRWLRVNQYANNAVKSGIDACSTAARPESSRFSLHASSQNGTAALKIPSRSSGLAYWRSPDHVSRHPSRKGTAGISASVPVRTRPKTTSPGVTSPTATLMNMNDDPQIAARASSIGNGFRVTARKTYRGPCLGARLHSGP